MCSDCMKGISMPINLIVIIAIAVLVLIVLAAFFTGAIGPGTTTISRAAALQSACTRLRTVYNCDITTSRWSSIEVPYEKSGDPPGAKETLRELCEAEGITLESECAITCGCPR